MKLAWFTNGDRNRASSRLRAWGIADRLPFESTFNDEAAAESADVVLVQKRPDLHEKMKSWATSKPVAWDCGDEIGYTPPKGVIVITPGHYFGPGIVLPGLVDVSESPQVKTSHGVLRRVCWYGDPLNQRHVYPVVVACERMKLECVLITDVERAEFTGCTYRQWSIDTVDAEIQACDLVACPFVDAPRKGENKLLKAWALGMPVVGTPVESYRSFGLRWKATTAEEWVDTLTLMRCPERRAADADLGRATVLWHQRRIIPAWESFLRGLAQ